MSKMTTEITRRFDLSVNKKSKDSIAGWTGRQYRFTNETRGIVLMLPNEVLPLLPAKVAKLIDKPDKISAYLSENGGRTLSVAAALDNS